MTIPTLMQNHQRKVYVTQLHKAYNELSQALLQYQTDRNAVSLTEAGLSTSDSIDSFVNTYFKIIQKCEDSINPCFSDSYKSLNGGEVTFFEGTSYVLASGVSIRIILSKYTNLVAQIGVDVNGQKGPNILGRDLFFIALYKNGILDEYTTDATAPLTEEQRETIFTNECMGAGKVSGWGCFGKILNNNWEMTY